MTKWFREVCVHGATIIVPRYIVRIDCRSTHGWQIRYAGSKFVSDYGRPPEESIKQAIAHLLSVFDEKKVVERGENKSKQVRTGVSGIQVCTDLNSRKVVFRVFDPLTRKSKKVHIGTLNTFESNLETAGNKALEVRGKILEEYRAQREKEQKQFKEALEKMA